MSDNTQKRISLIPKGRRIIKASTFFILALIIGNFLFAFLAMTLLASRIPVKWVLPISIFVTLLAILTGYWRYYFKLVYGQVLIDSKIKDDKESTLRATVFGRISSFVGNMAGANAHPQSNPKITIPLLLIGLFTILMITKVFFDIQSGQHNQQNEISFYIQTFIPTQELTTPTEYAAPITVIQPFPSPSPDPSPDPSPESNSYSSSDATCAVTLDTARTTAMLTALNEYRAKSSLPALPVNAQLSQAAQTHANDIACNNLFVHTGSDGSTPQTRVAATGYAASDVSENVYGSFPQLTGQGVISWWATDQTDIRHNENLLTTKYTEIGVAYAFFNNFGYYVLVFATP